MIINQGSDVNSHRGIYGTALQAASHFGHLETVRLLIDYQADVNAEGGEHGTALQAASSEGHFEIVRLLLDKRADVNAQPGAFATALQAASYNQHIDIISKQTSILRAVNTGLHFRQSYAMDHLNIGGFITKTWIAGTPVQSEQQHTIDI
ncbi:NACHT and ankyrin domain protein [Colletotrichum tofieldiae]|nr:NACHT and ankyrin domain protein [Colletotrichum tofieldiae]